MKKFLGELFIALGIVIAAGAGILLLASATFDVDLFAELAWQNGGAAKEANYSDGVGNSSESNTGGGTTLFEKFSPDDPYLAAAMEQQAADNSEDSSDGSAERDEGTREETAAKDPAEEEEQKRIDSYISMDGTYSGIISQAGGDFKVIKNISKESSAEDVGEEIMGEAAEESSADPSVTFTFAGDILFSGDYATGIQAGTNGIMSCFDQGTTELMQNADVFMVNNEFQYTTEGTPVPDKKYTLRANPGTVSWLKEMGADIVSLANNHMFDFQDVGLQDTLDTLRVANMPYVGAGENIEEASSTAYIHIVTTDADSSMPDVPEDAAETDSADEGEGGSVSVDYVDDNSAGADPSAGKLTDRMTIAIINATQVEQYPTPDTRGATETESGVFRCYDPMLLYQRVAEAKENADFVVVYIHWGVESTQEKEYRQDELADGIIKAGGDLIVGDHPHVLQAIGAVNGKPVAYSLGNYFFTSNTTDTGLLQAVFDPMSKTMTGLRFVPCLQTNLSVNLLDGTEKERVLDEMRGLSASCGVTLDDDGWVSWEGK